MILSEFLRIPLSPEEEKLVACELLTRMNLRQLFCEPLRHRLVEAERLLLTLGRNEVKGIARLVLDAELPPRIAPQALSGREIEASIGACIQSEAEPALCWLSCGPANVVERWCLIAIGTGEQELWISSIKEHTFHEFLFDFVLPFCSTFPSVRLRSLRYCESSPACSCFRASNGWEIIAWKRKSGSLHAASPGVVIPNRRIRISLSRSGSERGYLVAKACGWQWLVEPNAILTEFTVLSGGIEMENVPEPIKENHTVHPEVILGYLEMSLSEFLSLRPGDVIELPMNDAIPVKLRMAGVDWMNAEVSIGECGVKLTAGDFSPSQHQHTPTECSAGN